MTQILNVPLHDIFFEMISSSKESIKLCSPFIKNDIVDQIYKVKKDYCSFSLVTNINLMSMLKRSTDIEALDTILQNNGTIHNNQKLHAKIYLFDDKKAIITSANLTSSGLKRNHEYGVLVDELSLVNIVCKDYSSLCYNELTGRLKTEHIIEIKVILKSIPKPPKIFLPKLQLKHDEPSEVYFDKDISYIVNNLRGWKKAVFSALNFIEGQFFTTKDFSLIIPYLSRQYPLNRHIEAKIRQQLQELRDLGLIKFEGNGVYKKLWIHMP